MSHAVRGTHTFPVCLLRGQDFQNVYTATAVGCGEDCLRVDADLLGYAGRVLVAGSSWEYEGGLTYASA